ncbi:MAG TPA: protein translocase subunit SecD [Solibacterales bacterium]|nr:protein translocase subunit SecD [Bryobacterales bacterium]
MRVRTKFILIAAVVLAAILGITGFPKSAGALKTNVGQNIKLGLDLKGGSHLILQVQVQDAVKAEAAQTIERLKEDLDKAKIPFASMDATEAARIEDADNVAILVKGVPSERAGDFRSAVNERYPSWNVSPTSSTEYRLTMKPTELLALKGDTVKRSIDTINQRINGLGLTEPTIQQHGRADAEYEILVQLPGVDDPARVKQIMQTAAMLELYEVKDGPFPSREALLAKTSGVLPLGTKPLPSIVRAGETGEAWYLVSRVPVITGRDLRDSRPSQDEFGKWETSFVLTQDAKGRFGRFTESNIGNRLAIVLDGKVRSAPTIQNRIDDQGRITGAGSQQEASDLALVLRAGSLPAGIVYLEERTIGPSLGADSIRQGLVAGIVGLALVIAVMLVYYKGSGVNAVLALLLNTVLTISALAYFDAVWTLPGIAGLILSIGMAVDSNVLIFERIREELRGGKAPAAAVSSGFDRAFITIIDTHVTTVVASAFLFMFGTGPVKGFAVTLVIGLLANLFTAVFVSRAMFDFSLSRQPRSATLSI